MSFRSGFSAERVALLVGLLAFLAPVAARADTCANQSTQTCFVNEDGNGTSNGNGHVGSTTFSLTGSELTQVGWKIANMGMLSFKTGELTSGSLGAGGTFSATGSSFTLDLTKPYDGVRSGYLFKGAFSGPVTWAVVGTCTAGSACEYDLTGQISGRWYANGVGTVGGATVQLYFKTTGPYTGGPIQDLGGFSFVETPTVTPEPSSLGLMGTGLVGIALALKKARAGARSSRGKSIQNKGDV